GNPADPGIIGAVDIWQVAGIGGGSTTYLANLPQPNAARYVAFSPDNLYLAVMDMNNIRLYETVGWSTALDLPVGTQGSGLAFVPTLTDTSTRLLYGSGSNLVIWDLFAGRSQVASIAADANATITHIAPHPFGDLAAVVARSSGLTMLAIVDINNATVLYRENYPDNINSIAFDTAGYFLFVSNAGGNVSVYR
ncbi:MAG: WD40 repeat domain-containing protein, partial [Chloroflexi bacterium]